jgi:uncharacterized protein YceK
MNYKFAIRNFAVCLAMVFISNAHSAVGATQLTPLNISYTISFVSDKYGSATLGRVQTILKKTPTGYSVESATETEGLAAILMGENIQENCDFGVNNNRVVSQHYAGGQTQPGDYTVSYSWSDRKINFSSGESLDMPQGYILDSCNLPFAAALMKLEDLTTEKIYVVDGDKMRVRGYSLKSIENENLVSSIGTIDTIRVVLERELTPDRTLSFWFSPAHSYAPVKIEQHRKNRTTTLTVDSIN